MHNFPLSDFLKKVVTSTERVQFTHIDPYGHLNASRYVEFIINHRIQAVEDQLQVMTMDIAKSVGAAFVVVRLDIRYLTPCFLNEELEIGSWVENIQKFGFTLRVVISGEKSRKVHAVAFQEIRTVNFKTGLLIECPLSLPSRGDPSLLHNRPDSAEYTSQLIGYQEPS